MKKFIFLHFALTFLFMLSSCGSETTLSDVPANSHRTESSNNLPIETNFSRILIAYFSVPEEVSTTDAVAGASVVVKNGVRMGNTESVAKLIQETIGGDLFRIETVENYPLDHDSLVDQAADEKADKKRPELLSHVEDFAQYEIVILGFPNWWADLPMPVYTFLEEYDFGAKTIIPFVTHGGSGFSSTLRTISDLQPGAHVSGSTLSLSRNSVANSEQQVLEWANSLGLNAKEPTPENICDTVANAVADPQNSQTFYLWEENNMPTITNSD